MAKADNPTAVESVVPQLDPQWKKIYTTRLRRPFDPEDIEWKPSGIRGKFAYVEDRRYMERLDEVVGPENWHTDLVIGEREGYVHVMCTLTVLGTSKSSTGEAALLMGSKSNPNALTTAEAQAFKRACTRFGIGRYLYDLPKNVQETSQLPDWAKPRYVCSECGGGIADSGNYTAGEIRRRSMQLFDEELCLECAKKRIK